MKIRNFGKVPATQFALNSRRPTVKFTKFKFAICLIIVTFYNIVITLFYTYKVFKLRKSHIKCIKRCRIVDCTIRLSLIDRHPCFVMLKRKFRLIDSCSRLRVFKGFVKETNNTPTVRFTTPVFLVCVIATSYATADTRCCLVLSS